MDVLGLHLREPDASGSFLYIKCENDILRFTFLLFLFFYKHNKVDILYIFRIRKMHLCDSWKINHSLQLYQHTNKIHLHRSHYTLHNISSLSLIYLNLLRHRRLYDAIDKSYLIYIYLWEKACTVSSGTQILYKDVRCESVTWWYPGNFSVRTVREEWGLKWNAGMWTGVVGSCITGAWRSLFLLFGRMGRFYRCRPAKF